MRSQPAPITCRSLTKRFDGQPVVDDLTFEVTAGTVTGFVGANGAGKTTTLRMILGLVAPSAGEALVNGRPYGELERPRETVGAVLDGAGAHPAHSARAHLAVIAAAVGLPRQRVDDVLALVELAGHATRRVGSFSLGMRQRLALAAALLGDPPILVLDEPVNGLDPPGIIWMRDLLRRLATEGRAILISSHLLAQLAEVADRVVIIDRGRLVADGSLTDLLAGRSRAVEVRCAHPGALADAMRARGAAVTVDGDLVVIEGATAREAGETASEVGAGPVYQLGERAGTFEDVYVDLAGTIARPSGATTSERSAT